MKDAHMLAEYAQKIPAKINLIPCNPIPQSHFTSPHALRIHHFFQRLRERGASVTLRQSKGADIAASCGQLIIRQK